MKSVVFLLVTAIISCNITNVKASSFHSSSEDESNTIEFISFIDNNTIKNACREIWNDNLFKQNKKQIFKKINSTNKDMANLYITEILIRMLQDQYFKYDLINDTNFEEIGSVLLNYMKKEFVDNYKTYYNNNQKEKLGYYIMAKEQYKNNLMRSILDLGYDSVQNFNKYAKKCMNLYKTILFKISHTTTI